MKKNQRQQRRTRQYQTQPLRPIKEQEKAQQFLRMNRGHIQDRINAGLPARTVGSAARGGLFSAPGVGAAIGSTLAGPIGQQVGSLAGHAFRAITGYGDYSMDNNGQTPTIMSQPIVRGQTTGNTMVFAHREFIGDIVEPAANAGAFTIRQYSINAGNSIMFPWFSQIAAVFDQYRIRAMVFHYKPTSSMVNNAVGAGLGLGVVVMATDYDAADTPFTTKQQMEATQFCTSTVPYREMLHPIECKRNETVLPVLYVRTAAVPAGKDVRMYDMGNLFVATTGVPNNASAQTLGELWVTYEMEMLKPILSPGQAPTQFSFLLAVNSANATPAKPYGNSATSLGVTAWDGTVGSNTSLLSITLNPVNPQQLMVVNEDDVSRDITFYYYAQGASTVLTTNVTVTATGTAVALAAIIAAGSAISLPPAATSVIAFTLTSIRVSPGTGFLTLNTWTSPTALTNCGLLISVFR